MGIEHASSDIIVFIDADGSHSPDDIPGMVQPIKDGDADLVVGSRMRGGSDELHGDFLKFFRMVGSDYHTGSQLPFWCQPYRHTEWFPRHPDFCGKGSQPRRGHYHDRAGNGNQGLARWFCGNRNTLSRV